MKTKIKKSFFCLIRFLIRICGLQNAILLEMEPVKTDNTLPIYYEMLKRGWNKRYRIALLTNHPQQIEHLKTRGVSIVKMEYEPKHVLAFLKYTFARLRAVLILDQYVQIGKKNPSTVRVYLTHGSPAKSLGDYYNCSPDTDYMLNQSDFWKPVNAHEFKISEQKLVTLGYPRNDALFSNRNDLRTILKRDYHKVVAWYPTYRQHSSSTFQSPYREGAAIPILDSESEAARVNELAKHYDVLILVKPHPVQDVSKITSLNLSNILFLDNAFLERHKLLNYEMLAQTDTLISDYSSVIFDYMITGKPIALTFGDYDLYEKQVGFAIDMNILRSCCTMLETAEDFDLFFRDLVTGDDPLRQWREEIMHLTNQFVDGNSTKRVVDWLESLIKK